MICIFEKTMLQIMTLQKKKSFLNSFTILQKWKSACTLLTPPFISGRLSTAVLAKWDAVSNVSCSGVFCRSVLHLYSWCTFYEADPTAECYSTIDRFKHHAPWSSFVGISRVNRLQRIPIDDSKRISVLPTITTTYAISWCKSYKNFTLIKFFLKWLFVRYLKSGSFKWKTFSIHFSS